MRSLGSIISERRFSTRAGAGGVISLSPWVYGEPFWEYGKLVDVGLVEGLE